MAAQPTALGKQGVDGTIHESLTDAIGETR
jgi:hypothetical protein